MPGKDRLATSDPTDAIHAFNQELLELQQLPQAKLGRLLMPPSSSRERFFVRMLRVRAAIKAHGFREAARRATDRVLVKLKIKQPASVMRPPNSIAPGRSEDREEYIRTSLQQVQYGLPALQQYRASLNLSVSSRRDRGPSYVEHTPQEQPAGDPGVKLIAFYLPQFHPIPENDTEWGRGFTEWTNVTRAMPQFRGHYQPHLPEDVGFYDLRIKEVQERQVELAKNYGIYGFAIYYYWFAGKRVLEKPLDNFVENPKIDFPFCLIWANENWTRRWDGHEDDVFLAQVHTPESDVEFIKDAEKYLRHPNYIKVEGKPLLIVYKCQLLPNAAETIQRWRDYARSSGLGELYLMAAQTMGFEDPTPLGFDAAMQFPPHNEHMKPTVRLDYWDGVGPAILNKDFEGGIYSYPAVVEMKLRPAATPPYELYETAFPMWDNTARRPTNGWIYAYSSPELYRLWLTRLCNNALARSNPARRMVFLNAWNEWAEGAHLEPDRRYGYAFLKATRDARAISEKAACAASISEAAVPIDQHLHDQLYGRQVADPSSASRDPKSEITSSPTQATFVYQMGKVGSMSIVTELESRNLGHPVIHSHMLNDFDRIAENACKQYPNPVDVLYEVQRGRMIRDWMDEAGSDAQWNVITLTREPVGRNVSAFFQNIVQMIPNIEARLECGDLFVDELHELFLHVFNSRAPESWFDNQLKPVFGIDVYSEPYDFEKGYKILTAGQSRALLIRMEDLNRAIQPAMQALMSLSDFPARKENQAEEKYYSQAAAMFKQQPLPAWYIEAMYSTRYATHFYTAQELENLRTKWSA